MRTIAVALALALGVAAPAVAGPPWLTAEFRPFGWEVMLVRGAHGGRPMTAAPHGTAEGLVDGRRVSVPLRFDWREDVQAFGVSRTWPEDGTWILHVTAPGDHAEAGMVVGIDRNGQPAFVRFPRHVTGATRPATAAEIDAMLRALDAGTPVPLLPRTGWAAMILRMALPLAALAALVAGPAIIILRVRDRWRAARAARTAPVPAGAGTERAG